MTDNERAAAERLMDGAEPITEDWLREVGFVSPDAEHPNCLELHAKLYVCFGTHQTIWQAADHLDYPPKWYSPFEHYDPNDRAIVSRIPSCLWPKTRFDLRRLCAALGIELKEKA